MLLQIRRCLLDLKQAMTPNSWQMLNCHSDNKKKQKRAKKSPESHSPKFQQSRVDDESQSRQLMLMWTVSEKARAIEWKGEDAIIDTHSAVNEKRVVVRVVDYF